MEVTLFAVFSAIFGLAAYIPYIIGILKKEVKPARTSWIIWSILDILLLVSYLKSGAKETAALPLAFAIGAFIIAVLSIPYGKWVGFKDSLVCFIGSAIGVALWLIFSSAQLGLYSFIAVLAISTWPTLKKAYSDPESESLLAWILWFISAFLSILALGLSDSWEIAVASVPIAYLVLNIPMTLTIIIRRKIKKRT